MEMMKGPDAVPCEPLRLMVRRQMAPTTADPAWGFETAQSLTWSRAPYVYRLQYRPRHDSLRTNESIRVLLFVIAVMAGYLELLLCAAFALPLAVSDKSHFIVDVSPPNLLITRRQVISGGELTDVIFRFGCSSILFSYVMSRRQLSFVVKCGWLLEAFARRRGWLLVLSTGYKSE